VVLAGCGAAIPEALAAAEQLAEEDEVEATVLCLSSPDRLYRDWQTCSTEPLRTRAARVSHLEQLISDDERGLPVVTVIDGASHALAFVGSALGAPAVALGVDAFGQTGSQPELYAEYGIDPDAIAAACLAALERRGTTESLQ
jgi:pyruvate dehydrogenase E1 component